MKHYNLWKLILALIFTLQSTVAFAEKPPFSVDHPQLRAKGMSEPQMQLIFNAQAGQCKGEAAVLANSTYPNNPNPYGTLANGGVGISAATGAQAAQRQAAKEQLYKDSVMACMIEKGWVFTPTP